MSRRLAPFVMVAVLSLLATTATAQEIDLLAGMQARSIGPAGMSGRVAAIDVVVDDPDVIWVGAATGGVWKSVNGGATWEPVFDDQPVAAVGAVAIDPRAADVVWVGTGEGNPRNSVSVGNGIYRTRDGGRSWEHLGLEETERIHRILIDPSDSDTVYVAAMGRAWGENPERGIYKTTDGGASWDKVLYVDERTGAADLVMDPTNPDKLIAAMWEYRRWPFFFNSGGPGSGLWMTTDGGDTWGEITAEDGLPEGELGRIGLAFAPSDSGIVYALVEAEDNVLLRSEDGGYSWIVVNDDTGVSPRPFYYADLRVDPEWPDRVYRVASRVTVSDDGGSSFSSLGGPGFQVHPDHHAFWIHPEDPTFILDGNDGGISISRDRGETWEFVGNLPLAQFYHVAVDMDVPYNVYGGLQDNGSWRGPSAVWSGGFFGGGIRSFHWKMVAFGDGFDTRAMNDDPNAGYAMSQGGNLVRWNLASGVQRAIKPDSPTDEELRFNWNAGLALDPFDPDVVYYGSQFVHRSADRGETWEVISPDLTTDEPEWQQQAESGGLTLDVTAAENYTTIVALAPSPLQEGVLWVGTDDGRVHVTRDGGESWESLEGNMPDVPPNTWVPHIEASPHDPATAFVIFDDHRRSDWTPYVMRTDDWGRTWSNLAKDPVRGYTLSIVQDPVEPGLLFLGTEFGLWVSFDGGDSWSKWTHGVPTVSVMDLVIHPREHDLVVGTHGRAVYIIDDIGPLREVAAGSLQDPLHLYEIPDAQQFGSFAAQGELIPGASEFAGDNEPYGAIITYSLSSEELEPVEVGPGAASGPPSPFGDGEGPPDGPRVKVEILDAAGDLVRTLRAPARRGLSRAVWNLRADPFRSPGGGGFFGFGGGPEVPPGTYTVRLSHGEESVETSVRVLLDPRLHVTEADIEAKWEAIQAIGALRELGTDAIERIEETRRDIAAVLARVGDGVAGPSMGPGDDASGPPSAAREEPSGGQAEEEGERPSDGLTSAARELREALTEVEKLFRVPPDTKGIPADESALAKVGEALNRLQSTWEAPSASDRTYMRQAREAMAASVGHLNELFATRVADFRALVREAEIELLPEAEPLRMPER